MDFFSLAKIIHILAVIAWMAALLYLPRLLVYHAKHANVQAFVDIVRVQERRLYFMIAVPAMIFVLISGGVLLYFHGFSGAWLHFKLLLVVLLVIYHHVLGFYVKRFNKTPITKSEKFFKIFNEIPTILLIFIISAVVIRF